MKKKKKIKRTVSSDIVNFLWKRGGLNLKEIGSLMGGLSQTYLSRIASGKRNLRLEHLVLLEESLGISFPWLILIAHYEKSVPKKLCSSYKAILRIRLERIKLEEWKRSQNKKALERKCRKE